MGAPGASHLGTGDHGPKTDRSRPRSVPINALAVTIAFLARSRLIGSWLRYQGEGTIPSIPNRQSVPIEVQMSVVEASRILQTKSKHSVKTDVSDPDEGQRKSAGRFDPKEYPDNTNGLT